MLTVRQAVLKSNYPREKGLHVLINKSDPEDHCGPPYMLTEPTIAKLLAERIMASKCFGQSWTPTAPFPVNKDAPRDLRGMLLPCEVSTEWPFLRYYANVSPEFPPLSAYVRWSELYRPPPVFRFPCFEVVPAA
jgi:hypothetical protein